MHKYISWTMWNKDSGMKWIKVSCNKSHKGPCKVLLTKNQNVHDIVKNQLTLTENHNRAQSKLLVSSTELILIYGAIWNGPDVIWYHG